MVVRARKLPVPDCTGLGHSVADRVLRGAGFPGARFVYVEAYEPVGTVVGQEPGRGALQESDRPVLLRVSKQNLIRYLPTVYHPRSPDDRAFLRDFLWIFQHLVDSVTDRVGRMHELFNPYTTDPEFLPWLASWFALSFDEHMPEDRRRRALREAAMLYRVRGTSKALTRMVKLFTDLDVGVAENQWPYKGMRIGVTARVGIDTMVLPEISMSQTFVVRVPRAYDEIDESTLLRLHDILQTEKPANTNYFLQFSGEEGVRITGGFMRVGVTQIGLGQEVTEDSAPDGTA
jgi:phage tail-like protein